MPKYNDSKNCMRRFRVGKNYDTRVVILTGSGEKHLLQELILLNLPTFQLKKEFN
jgi:hypothetical protein